MHDVDLRLELEQLHAEMLRRAGAGRSVGKLARLLGRELDQLAHRAGGKAGMGHDHQRAAEDVGDRLEVDQRPVGQVGIEAGIDAEGAAGGDQQRVAVGRRRLAGLGARNAAAPALVVDQDLLLPGLRQPLRHQPREDVRRLPGRKRHDDAHGLGRPRRLRGGACGDQRRGQGRGHTQRHGMAARYELRHCSSRHRCGDRLARHRCRARSTQGSMTFTSRPPRRSTRCMTEPPSTCESPCHFTLLVTYQTPSGTRGKEKLPIASQRTVRRVET